MCMHYYELLSDASLLSDYFKPGSLALTKESQGW